jgi:hypothetical protein
MFHLLWFVIVRRPELQLSQSSDALQRRLCHFVIAAMIVGFWRCQTDHLISWVVCGSV